MANTQSPTVRDGAACLCCEATENRKAVVGSLVRDCRAAVAAAKVRRTRIRRLKAQMPSRQYDYLSLQTDQHIAQLEQRLRLLLAWNKKHDNNSPG